jgi:aryl-alcohol dehydrogenase-like predicted oxidoreductase
MKYNYIGKSGLRMSNICMGTMTFGKKCDKKVSFEILDKAYANGVNFFDTAEDYPVPPTAETYGITEEIFGEWMASKPRDSIILATKVAGAANAAFPFHTLMSPNNNASPTASPALTTSSSLKPKGLTPSRPTRKGAAAAFPVH